MEMADKCEVCDGTRGVPGNENVINGVTMCDYCHAERYAVAGRLGAERGEILKRAADLACATGMSIEEALRAINQVATASWESPKRMSAQAHIGACFVFSFVTGVLCGFLAGVLI